MCGWNARQDFVNLDFPPLQSQKGKVPPLPSDWLISSVLQPEGRTNSWNQLVEFIHGWRKRMARLLLSDPLSFHPCAWSEWGGRRGWTRSVLDWFGLLAEWAEQLTEMGKGKHFIGDFLPPDELEKFMETFKALKVSVWWLLPCRCLGRI